MDPRNTNKIGGNIVQKNILTKNLSMIPKIANLKKLTTTQKKTMRRSPTMKKKKMRMTMRITT